MICQGRSDDKTSDDPRSLLLAAVPFSFRWHDQWRNDAKTIESKYGAGILATKSILNTDHPPGTAGCVAAAINGESAPEDSGRVLV
jgi:hypothetical protein